MSTRDVHEKAVLLASRATSVVRQDRKDIHIWSPPQGHMTGWPFEGLAEVWDFDHKKWRPWEFNGQGYLKMHPDDTLGNLDISPSSDLLAPDEILKIALDWSREHFPKGRIFWCTHNGGFECLPASPDQKADGKYSLLLDARIYR